MFKIIIFSSLSTILFLNWKYRSYNSPYKLHMVFGKKGSGKSTFFAKVAHKALKKKKFVYTNMSEMVLNGVRHINPADVGKFTPPPNSVLLLDESGILYDNRKFSSFTDDQRNFYKLQRHYKVEVWLASQSFDVDKKLRDLCDDMFLCTRLFPWLTLCRPIRKSVCLIESSALGESRIADNLKFKLIFSWRFIYLPRWTKSFDSFHAPSLPEISYFDQ